MTSRENVEHELVSYLTSEPRGFYKRAIYKLVHLYVWNDILGSDGDYVND